MSKTYRSLPQIDFNVLLADTTTQYWRQSPNFTSLETGHNIYQPGWRVIRENGTSDWLVTYTVSGSGLFRYAGGVLNSTAHTAVLIKPGTPHDFGIEATATEDWDVLWCHFHPWPHWVEWLVWPEAGSGLMYLRLEDPAKRSLIHDALLNAFQYEHGELRLNMMFAMHAVEEALLWCDTQNPLSAEGSLDIRVRDAIHYIRENIGLRFTLPELAAACHASVSRLSHLFREQTGVSPLQYAMQQRIIRARQLLETTRDPVRNIAASVGFENAFHFSAAFRKETGLSPSVYRHQYRKISIELDQDGHG